MLVKPGITIIIVAHNKVELTRRCLEAICAEHFPCEFEVVLVGNCCSDATPDLPSDFADRIPGIRYVSSDENMSYSAANNAAAKLARHRWLLFLNNDVQIRPGSMNRLFRAVEREDHTGVAGSKLMYPDTHTIQHAGMLQMLWGYPSNYGVGGNSGDPRFNETREVFAVTGAMLCIDGRLFDRVEGFDEGYWYGFEDVDLCLKVREVGYRVLYLPGSSACHFESATLSRERKTDVFASNYSRYRTRWNSFLAPREEKYLASLRAEGIHSVVIFGTGLAASGLCDALTRAGIQVTAFTASKEIDGGERFLDRPVVPLRCLPGLEYDRLIVGSQFYYQIEGQIADCDPKRSPIFPVIS